MRTAVFVAVLAALAAPAAAERRKCASRASAAASYLSSLSTGPAPTTTTAVPTESVPVPTTTESTASTESTTTTTTASTESTTTTSEAAEPTLTTETSVTPTETASETSVTTESSTEATPSATEATPTETPTETPTQTPTESATESATTESTTTTSAAAAIETANLLAGSLAQIMVDKHTAERAAYSAGAVTWNQSLADAAQAWADGCKYGHATNGENIAAGTDGYSSADLFDLWASERVYYDWANPGPNSLDPQQDVGHWTQIVWKASTQIGCGLATCATLKDSGFGDGVSAAYLVCRYYEQGNLQIYGTGVNNYEVNIGPAV